MFEVWGEEEKPHKIKKKRGQYGKHVSALLFLYYVTQQIHIVVEKNNTF